MAFPASAVDNVSVLGIKRLREGGRREGEREGESERDEREGRWEGKRGGRWERRK